MTTAQEGLAPLRTWFLGGILSLMGLSLFWKTPERYPLRRSLQTTNGVVSAQSLWSNPLDQSYETSLQQKFSTTDQSEQPITHKPVLWQPATSSTTNTGPNDSDGLLSSLQLSALQKKLNNVNQEQSNHAEASAPSKTHCNIPEVLEVRVEKPFWTASYPGSGAKLTWKLVRALTGVFTGDDHDHNGRVKRGMAVAIKTHYPSHTEREVMDKFSLRLERCVLLVRNPLAALPSFHNFVYEQERGLRNHSTRAPVDAWVRWRNEFFESEMEKWVQHIQYWIQQYPPTTDSLFLLPFEHLVSDKQGSSTLQEMHQFIKKSHYNPAVDNVSCVWEMFVQKSEVPGEKERRYSHRTSGGPEGGTYPYTQDQLTFAHESIQKLQQEQTSFLKLSNLLQEYLQDIEERKAKIEEMNATT